ncbi:hypothetical protein MEQU1_001957 [Malassezia equina]|uniref:NADP-dependent oxidoreductase domain-containing protein n=1 Tax=Malassezia equina TaxID=1381935 RepID=A0AAF0EF59_9BASI|nr:hypothetical protein MEQU1_001957 [Malassezia equina]
MTESQPFATLNTGAKVPMIALGCFMGKPGGGQEVVDAVKTACEQGYRHFDTAAYYMNEDKVGQGLRESGVPRDQLFVTTKLRNDRHHDVEAAFDESLQQLNVDYIDMYLMHWPNSTKPNEPYVADDSIDYIQTWKNLERLLETRAGKVKAIGVSNFSTKTLPHLLEHAKIVPAMNQIETHPYNQSSELIALCQKNGIVVSAYSPLGLTDSPIMKDEDVLAVAKELNATPAQVILNWNVQRGVVVLPKSITPSRIEENFKVVKLTDAQMEKIHSIEKDPQRQYRLCKVFDPKTQTVFGWSYERLGWTTRSL